jgi:predicted regulator of Ras-like GTPase activity (Roadblock/LC7/MglB family)
LPAVDAAQALADLVEISAQIEAAVLAAADGTVLASTLADEERAGAVARDAVELLQAAAGGAGEPVQLEAAVPEGSVFVVRDEERLVAAVTGRDPTTGLVLYDLKTCLRLAGENARPAKKAASRPRKKKDEGEAADGAA